MLEPTVRQLNIGLYSIFNDNIRLKTHGHNFDQILFSYFNWFHLEQ